MRESMRVHCLPSSLLVIFYMSWPRIQGPR
jgi:hypothetical protein